MKTDVFGRNLRFDPSRRDGWSLHAGWIRLGQLLGRRTLRRVWMGQPNDKSIALTRPLLRAPPFPGPAVSLVRTASPTITPAIDDTAIDALFDAVRHAKVGGAFWSGSADPAGCRLVVRAKSANEIATVHAGLDAVDRNAVLWLPPTDDVDPWSVLMPDMRLLAHGDDEWVALAHIAGCAVHVLSAGTYGMPGMDEDTGRAYAARALLGAWYRDPFTGGDTTVEATIARLASWRRTTEANRGIVAACGIAWWKRREITRVLWSPGQPLRFFRSERRALAHAVRNGGAVAIWPSRVSGTMAGRAEAMGTSLVRVEDGFVRSVGLGSDMVPPSSVTVDRLGIHYDPTRASELEALLADASFAPSVLSRAANLRNLILAGGISKYGHGGDHVFPPRQKERRLVLVPGQVEDDMSVRLGGAGLSGNLDLLRRVRALEPDAEIWFRPHPDVDAGHRTGAVCDADALAVADRIVRGGGMATLLDLVDAVHVITSLTGFEALLRGRAVTCHGMPFYAGWGLTRDLSPVPDRRGRTLTLDQLVAGVLILYPRYVDPVTGLPCEPETLLGRMVAGNAVNRLSWVTPLRQLQGRLMKGRR